MHAMPVWGLANAEPYGTVYAADCLQQASGVEFWYSEGCSCRFMLLAQ